MPSPVTSGQRLKIVGAEWNQIREVVEMVLRQRGLGLGEPLLGAVPSGCIRIRNDCGEDRSKFEVLAIGEILNIPSDDADQFQGHQPAFKGEAIEWPTYIGKFGVLLADLPEDEIGVAMVSGVIRTKLKIQNAAHRFADIESDSGAGDQYRLRTNYAGGAEILYFEDQDDPDASGDKWAVVRVGAFHNPTMVGRLTEELEVDAEAACRVQYGPGGWSDGHSGEVVDVTDYKLAETPSLKKLEIGTRVDFSMDRDTGKFAVRGWKGCSVPM